MLYFTAHRLSTDHGVYRMLLKQFLSKNNYCLTAEEKLKAVLLILVMVVSIAIMTFDVYGSILHGYTQMAVIESLVILFVIALYFLFPKYVPLRITTYIMLFFLTLFILLSLMIPGHNPEFVLFALAIVPAYLFSLLGLKEGFGWSIVIIFILFLATLNAYVKWIEPLFSFDLLLQVNIAYIILSLFHYKIEKERSRYETQLGVALKGKDVLLKEVHHRAKNNLQTIMGLLESQAMRTEESQCRKLLTSQRHRLQSMSLLHENLAVESNYEEVNMAQYLSQIIHNIQKGTEHEISVDIDSFLLEMADAVNVGLFLNEAVSNAIEHAYSKDRKGKIDVSLKCLENICTLRIKDYGQGFDASKVHNSLGLVLMEDISHFFNDGTMMLDFDTGVEVIATFSLKKGSNSNG